MGLSKYVYTHTKTIESFCLIVCGLLAFTPYVMLNLIGIAVAIGVVLLNRKRKRKLNSVLIPEMVKSSESM